MLLAYHSSTVMISRFPCRSVALAFVALAVPTGPDLPIPVFSLTMLLKSPAGPSYSIKRQPRDDDGRDGKGVLIESGFSNGKA